MRWGRVGRSQQEEQPQPGPQARLGMVQSPGLGQKEQWCPLEKVRLFGEVPLGQEGCPVPRAVDGDLPVVEPSECRTWGQQMVETRWF